MEAIREIAVAMCATMAVTGILSILIPGKSMERTMRLVVGVFFLASIVIPFATQEFALSFEDLLPEGALVTAEVEATAQSHMEELTESRLEQEVSLLLSEQGITPEKVDVSIHISEDKRISITNLYIVLQSKDQDQEQEVSSKLHNVFGVDPQLVIAGESADERPLEE